MRLALSNAFNPHYRVYIDFDNTISRGDVLDSVIEKFACDETWRDLEEAWAKGKIGARECLDGQLSSVKATDEELHSHLAAIQIDPGLHELLKVIEDEHIEYGILSDNFDLILMPILKRLGLSYITCYSNKLQRKGDYFTPSFPYWNKDCPGCAHCKKTHFTPRGTDTRKVIYIGDGRSDICPSLNSDIVFAKDSLLTYLNKSGVSCIPYHDLAEVAKKLSNLIHDNSTTNKSD
jgi:2-hydroxy-3-keto-5-methylthiopentenyl-1-phosphate phosphatase